MRLHLLPVLLGVLGLVLVAVGVGLWAGYPAGLIIGGLGLVGASWMLSPAPGGDQ